MKRVPEYIKVMAKGLLPTFVFVTTLLIVFAWLPGKSLVTLLLLVGVMVWGMLLFNAVSDRKPFEFLKAFKRLFKALLVVTGFYLLVALTGQWGVLGTLLVIGVWAGYRLVSGRKQYMKGVREIEKMIWGKTLDKDQWRYECEHPDFPKWRKKK